jgi:aspartate aminotransferase
VNPIAVFETSRRLRNVTESATLRLNAKVNQLRSQGRDIVNLTTGEPDFDVPSAAKAAVEEGLRKNLSKYTPVAGIAELRERIAVRTNRQQPAVVAARGEWKASHVVVTNGGKQAIFNALLATVDPGDEVLIPAPFWVSYPDMAKICEGVPRILSATLESGWKITPEQLRAALGPKSRVLFLNSPSNPTGAMYSREELRALGQVIRSHPEASRLIVISDEIYDRIVLDRVAFCSFAEACPELVDRIVTVNGLSKSAAMTGWRVGWSVAVPAITEALAMLQGQSTSGINSLAQAAAVAALGLPESDFEGQVSMYRHRRDVALEILHKAGRIKMMSPQGAFYVLLGVEGYFKPGEDATAFCERVLEEAGVALVPGDPFGMPGTVRLSFATDETSLASGCRRFVDYLNR